MAGFTSHLSRFSDDKLTVVVLTNLNAEYSYPEVIVRGVAGLIEPELKLVRRAKLLPISIVPPQNLP